MVRRYGRPSKGQHAVQIEIDRSIYMDEKTVEPNSNFGTIRSILKEVTRKIADLGRSQQALAAE